MKNTSAVNCRRFGINRGRLALQSGRLAVDRGPRGLCFMPVLRQQKLSKTPPMRPMYACALCAGAQAPLPSQEILAIARVHKR